MSNTDVVWCADGLLVVGAVSEQYPMGYPIAACLTPSDATYVAFALNKLSQE